MSIATILEMAASAFPDRPCVTGRGQTLSYAGVHGRAALRAAELRAARVSHLVYVGVNDPAFAVAMFAAAMAGVPLVPINYRLGNAQLSGILAGLNRPYVLADEDSAIRLAALNQEAHALAAWCDRGLPDHGSQAPGADAEEADPDSIAVLLQTSGTSSAPKSAILRHSHMTSYLFGSLDFASADESEAALVSVPPYHVAGVTNLLSNVYATRRIVYLDNFTASDWLATAQSQHVTHAMLIPTMLGRVVDALEKAGPAPLPCLRSIAYGGAAVARTVVEKALTLLPQVDFVNAYGLTETSSTIAVLGPEDHRAAMQSTDPDIRARLGSAGLPLPGLEIEIRDAYGNAAAAGVAGSLWVRGPQVSGEYVGRAAAVDAGGWFETRDRARIDAGGYLFIEGRQDDTIIRGGENIAPAEIEDVLLQHPDVIEAVVVGVPDEEWGQRIVAAVRARAGHAVDGDELRRFVRGILRSSKTPDRIEFWETLPYTDTGKLLRRKVAETLGAPASPVGGQRP